MGKRVTIQDIADNLGLSRNTVSKALNNTGVLAEDTRRKILDKAAEMGYGRFIYIQQAAPVQSAEVKELALITQNMPYGSHFGTFALNSFQKKISRNNFRLSMFPARTAEIRNLQLPLGLDIDRIEGIVCMELFDSDYIEMLGTLGVPLLFIDTAYNTDFSKVNADFLLMENRASIFSLTDTLIRNGLHRLSFAGNYRHCRSFYERFQGFSDALREHGLSPVNSQFADSNTFSAPELLEEAVKRLLVLPDVFVCANDFVAIDLIRVLKKLGIQVPEDVRVTGFDNSAESRIIEPHLTTVNIPSTQIGDIAADMLLSRISEPETPYRIMHVRTTTEFRDSTGVLKL